MNMIAALNTRLNKAVPELQEKGRLYSIGRNTDLTCLVPTPPEALLQELQALQQRVSPLIPDDFDFDLSLGGEEPMLYTSYPPDTPDAGFDELPLDLDTDLAEQLGKVDWEERREEAVIAAVQNIEAMAQHLFSPAFSTKALQKAFREDMKSWIKEVRKDATHTHILFWDDNPFFDEELDEEEEEPGLDTLSYPTYAAFLDDLEFLIIDSKFIVTIVADGKPLSVDRIDRLKRDATNRMKAKYNVLIENGLAEGEIIEDET